MIFRFALPDLGEGVAEGEVVEWLVAPGQAIAADDPIAEVATDKVNVEIPSPVAGVVATLVVAAGETVPVGTVLIEILTGDDAPASVEPGPASPEPAATVRALASEGERRTRATIARRMTAAAAVPTVTNVEEFEFEAVSAAGARPLTAVAHATVAALRKHPLLNAWGGEDGEVRPQERVHLGIATQAPQGLVVPVVHDAHLMAAEELERAIAAVTTAAREGRARPDDLRGSTFTISSAGRQAGLLATPLLNLPEVAILGLYRVRKAAVVIDGEIVARKMAHLSISFDHRALDGLTAAAFLARVGELIEGWPS